MNDFEDRVRRALRSGVPAVEVEPLLAEVHRGATGRRRRRIAGAIAASALVVAGAAGVATTVRGDEGTLPEPPLATQTSSPSPSPTLPAGASRGVIDVSVISADRWFRLTTNVGCVACTTVWQNEQSAEGGWERLHDFGTEAYVGKVDPTFGPIERLVMAEDGENGWAWGRRLYATHDGGRTWAQVTTGPGRVDNEFGHQVGITDATGTAWSLLRTGRGTELWRTSLGSDEWVRADAPNMGGVSGMLTLTDYVLLETSDEGLSAPRLQYYRDGDGLPWGEVANPCQGENAAYAGISVAFMLCGSGNGATAYRLVGVEHPVAGKPAFEWYEFGRTSGAVSSVLAIDDRHLIVVGTRGRATLLTDRGGAVDAPATSTAVDLGLGPGEETGSVSSPSSDRLVMVTTFGAATGARLLGSTDSGRTWHEAE
jgi:hypothetical protein